MQRSHRRLRAYTAVATGVLLVSACTSAKPAAAPPSTALSTASATAAPSASASPAAGVGAPTALDAYRDMWAAYVAAIKIPDPAYPGLTKYAQGDALAVWVRGLTSVKNDGLVGKGTVTLAPHVTAANPNANPPTVQIKDCVDLSKSHLVKKDGSPYHDTPDGKEPATATVTRLPDGTWRVSSFALFNNQNC